MAQKKKKKLKNTNSKHTYQWVHDCQVTVPDKSANIRFFLNNIEAKAWTKNWGFHYRSYGQRDTKREAWDSPVMRETPVIRSWEAAVTPGALHIREAKPGIQRDEDGGWLLLWWQRQGLLHQPRAGGGTSQLLCLAGPFLEEQDLLYLLPTQSLSAPYPWVLLLSDRGGLETWGLPPAPTEPLTSSQWRWSTVRLKVQRWQRVDAGLNEHQAAGEEQQDSHSDEVNVIALN